MTKRLSRKPSEKMICGVAAGLARYLGIDPVIVRVAWVVAILLPGPNLILVAAYFILCVLMPVED